MHTCIRAYVLARAWKAATVACDLAIKSMEVGGRVVTVNLWNTCGQERFAGIVKGYFRSASGALVVCSMADPETLTRAKESFAVIYALQGHAMGAFPPSSCHSPGKVPAL